MTNLTMTPDNPRWYEFIAEMQGPNGCADRCDCTARKPITRKILERMGMDVLASFDYFHSLGGFCDCEVILNVIGDWKRQNSDAAWKAVVEA